MTDVSLIATVNAHLKQLEAGVSYTSDEATLRVATASLRILLADDALIQAWRLSKIGGPMTFSTMCISEVKPGPVLAFCGGGDLIPNVPFSVCRGASLERKTLEWKTFCNSTRIQVDQTKISTVELVRFVANSLGGVHFDQNGKAAKKEKGAILNKLASGELIGVPIQISGRNNLHHEILSIAQSVIRSPQVAMLRRWQST